MISCPSPTDLERAFAALLGGREDPAVVDHVEVCRVCQARLETWLADSAVPHPNGRPEACVRSHPSAQDQTEGGNGPAASGAGSRKGVPERLPEVPGYEILSRLGHGGMGVVYKARHQRLNRVVALKMILAGEHADPDRIARFHLEAEAVARLRHPNIVAIHDIGVADGMPYIALEYLPGGSLEQLFQQGPLNARSAAALLAALAQAVHTAHLAGIVHRDLKPNNVLRAEDGTAKVTDFGLAKRLEQQGQTQTGQIIGTPAYMAPEQARGKSKSVGPTADVYALGAILYEALTGRPPFRGETMMQTLQMVLAEEPLPPRRFAPGLAADLETVCLKALRKEPGERYATAQELADELNRFLHDEPVRARPLRRLEKAYRWCRRNPTLAGLLAAAAALLLMVGVAGTLGVYHVLLQNALAGKEEQRDRAEEALREAKRYLYLNRIHLAAQAYRDIQLARAGDVLRDCLAEERGWEWHYLRRITEAHVLIGDGHTQAVQALAFARHGRWLVSGSADRSLLFWEAASAKMLLKLAGHTGPVWGVALSPDGRRLASVAGSARDAGELIVWDLTEGSTPQARVAFRKEGVGEHAAVAFHPSRPLLAVAAGTLAGEPSCLLLLDGDGREVRRWQGSAGQGCVALAWSGDGRRLAASHVASGGSDASSQTVICEAETGEVLHRFTPHGGQTLALAYSEDGRVLATAGADRTICVWDARDHTLRHTLRGHAGAINALSWTPGGWLLSASNDTTVRAWDPGTGQELFQRRGHYSPVRCVAVHTTTGRIYSGSSDTKIKAWRSEKSQEAEVHALHKGAATAVAFSPDAKALVSVGLDGAVWRIDPTGHERPRKLRQEQRPLRQVRCLPGSQTLLVAGGAAGPGRDDGTVALLDARDGRPCGELATGLTVASSLSLSRDGRWLSVVGQTKEQKTVA